MEKRTTALTCPECRGPLSKERQERIVEYACRVGHRYSPLAVKNEHYDTVERSLWAFVVALEEAADIAEWLAPELGQEGIGEASKQREQPALLKTISQDFPRTGPNEMSRHKGLKSRALPASSAPFLPAALAQNFLCPVGAMPAQNTHLDIADFLIVNKNFFDLLQDHLVEARKILDICIEQRGLCHRN